jgi:hypothetical protein
MQFDYDPLVGKRLTFKLTGGIIEFKLFLA